MRGRKNRSRLLAVLLALITATGILPMGPMGAGQAEAAETGQVIINEFGQGTSGNSFEWVELVVVGAGPGSAVDMRGWDLGDTSAGDLSFNNDAKWSAVPAGTIIIIYNNYAVIPHNHSALFTGSWGGLNNSGGDAVVLRNASDQVVDGISYGTDATQNPQIGILSPSGPAVWLGSFSAPMALL